MDGVERYRSALVARLGREWADEEIAARIVGAVDDRTLGSWELVVPLERIADSPLLTHSPPADDGPFEAILVFAFGHRGTDGCREPGPVNEELARVVARHVRHDPVPVFAQTEPAIALRESGIDRLVEIDLSRRPDGSVIYQSTIDFTREVAELRGGDTASFGRVAVVASSDHLGRCVRVARAAGFDAVRSSRIGSVDIYDSASTQPWTRSREAYLSVDLAARFL